MSKQRLPKNPYVITGIKTGRGADGKWPARREIDEMMNDPDRKHAILFTVAYRLMQQRPLDDVLSYYSIGGIHGYPPRPWPVADGPRPPNNRGIYCEHHTYFFPTWHRCHMLLIEQALHDIILTLVEPSSTEIPIRDADRDDWRAAAATWRLPYWDPGMRREYNGNNSCIPESAMNENVAAEENPGTGISLPFLFENPLYAYRPPLKPGETIASHGMKDVSYSGGVLIPATKQQRTVRYAPFYDANSAAIEKLWVQGTGDVDKLKANFALLTSSWREMLVSIFNDISRYHRFVYGQPTQTAADHLPSLTDFHDNIHGNTGGDTANDNDMTFGNMCSVPVAALDPIFFLWHCCVDRYIALWQAGHPGKTGDVWLTAAEDIVPLYPFVGPSAQRPDWWVSRDCRNIDNLGYTYTDVEDIRSSTTPTAALRQFIEDTYGDFFEDSTGPGSARGLNPNIGEEGDMGSQAQYIFTIAYKLHECGPFRCNIYLDDPANPSTSHLLGNIICFVAPQDDECGNCEGQRAAGKEVESSTIISARLRELHQQGVIGADYEEAMSKGLRWQVRNMRGELISREEFPSLRVGVTKRVVEGGSGPGGSRGLLPGGDRDGEVRAEPLRGVTDGKEGGLGHGEDFV